MKRECRLMDAEELSRCGWEGTGGKCVGSSLLTRCGNLHIEVWNSKKDWENRYVEDTSTTVVVFKDEILDYFNCKRAELVTIPFGDCEKIALLLYTDGGEI